MSKMQMWLYVLSAVLIALLTNSISAIWASRDDKFSWWLLAIFFLAPLVFITFGLVVSKIGLAIGSASIDTLLAVSTILVGLFLFGEWNSVAIYQYIGMIMALAGVVIMHLNK